MEGLARDKHSSLLWKFVNYGQKSFITLAPGGRKWQLIYPYSDKHILLVAEL
jgi:hypothetical protein